MKKLLILAFSAISLFSCSKDPQLPVTDSPAANTSTEESSSEYLIAPDRDAAAYTFNLTGSTLGNYCFKAEVIDVESGLRVWRQGGCYTGNKSFLVFLTPGKMYAATVVMTPWTPGQQGSINWSLMNIYGGPTLCSSGTLSIPNNPQQQLPWPACIP